MKGVPDIPAKYPKKVKEGPGMDYSGLPFAKPSKKKKGNKRRGKVAEPE